MKFPSSLRVGSFLIFPTGGTSRASRQACDLIRYRLKQDGFLPDGRSAIATIAERLITALPGTELEAFLGEVTTLVPVVRRQPLRVAALWPSMRVCEELLRVGIGSAIETAVERVEPVGGAGSRNRGERLSPEDHYPTLRALPFLMRGGVILLVDDVVSRGATVVACAARLLEAMPGLNFRAFAFARVELETDLGAVGDMLSPRVETITRYASGKLWRK